MSSKESRQNQIINILERKTSCSPKELSYSLNVSEMTIRRDIQEMLKKNMVTAKYGSVRLSSSYTATSDSFTTHSNYFSEAEKCLVEKMQIGKYASTLIEPMDAIAIDNGKTCFQILNFMPKDLWCIIYTYSKSVIDKFDESNPENARLFALGGYYHSDLKMFEHTQMVDTINTLHLNKFFMGATGVSTKYGLSCVQPYEVEIRQALIEHSDQVILLADSSKMDKSWYDHYADISAVDILITDSGITLEQQKEIEDCGIDLRIV